MTPYDVIVIGGGTAGLVTAAGSAGIGARVALIERDRLGGECLWNGCVPSKALIASARAAADARSAPRMGVRTGTVEVDFPRTLQWVRNAQRHIAPHDSPERFRSLGVEVVNGEARFTGARSISVDGRVLTGKRVVIATGSAPAVPPIDGLRDGPYLTNESVFSLHRLPSRLLVLGGGPIGLELAQAFARLGSSVQVLEAATQLLPREDHELAALLVEQLEAEGVQVHLGAKVERVEHVTPECVRLHVAANGTAGAAFTLEGDALLVAAGRSPRVESLDLGVAGIESSGSGITVDAGLRTSAEGVWAAGDCVGPLRFTHVADYQARLVIRNAFMPFRGKAEYRTVPWVTFTDPELAHVGLTEQEAREQHGTAVRVWRRPFGDLDRAITDGQTSGMVKLITNGRGRILGGHVLGHGAGNLIGEITLAMKHGISAHALGATIHAYPTYSEAIRQAAEQYTKSKFRGALKRAVQWYVRR